MASQFTADLNPKSNAMSLGDMMKMGLYSAEADVLNRQAHVAREQEKEIPVVQSFLNGPDSKDENGDWDLKRVNTVLPSLAPLTGPGYADKINGLVRNTAEATKARLNLSKEARTQIASLYGAYADAKVDDPQVVAQGMMNLGQEVPELVPYITPILRNMEHAEKGPKFLEGLYVARNKVLSPTEGISAYGAQGSVSNIGGASRPVVTRNSATGGNPTITPTEFGGGGTTGGPAIAPKSNPKDRDIVKYDTYLDYKQDPSLANYNDEQKAALESGKTLLKNSNMLANAAKEQEANTRGVYENLAATAGSRPGQMVRQGGKWLAGNASLELLNKNIERMAAASEVMGTAKTDASRETARIINGSTDLTEKALADITSRADATVQAATMFNKAYNNLIEKRGVNGYIQSEKLKSAWADNYDVRMVQMDALAKSNAPGQKEKRQEIWNSVNKDQREEFIKRWENLHALEQGKFR